MALWRRFKSFWGLIISLPAVAIGALTGFLARNPAWAFTGVAIAVAWILGSEAWYLHRGTLTRERRRLIWDDLARLVKAGDQVFVALQLDMQNLREMRSEQIVHMEGS